jgi:hypothetical protein
VNSKWLPMGIVLIALLFCERPDVSIVLLGALKEVQPTNNNSYCLELGSDTGIFGASAAGTSWTLRSA